MSDALPGTVFCPEARSYELPLRNGGVRAVAAPPRTDGLRDLERSRGLRALRRRKVQEQPGAGLPSPSVES